MHSCIGISISIKKQHFFRFLGMCHMCARSFLCFRRALSSSEGSELMFVHFQVKGFDQIRPTTFPTVVFICSAATAYIDSELRFEKKLIFDENPQIFTGNEGSEYVPDFDARGTQLALFFKLNPKMHFWNIL